MFHIVVCMPEAYMAASMSWQLCNDFHVMCADSTVCCLLHATVKMLEAKLLGVCIVANPGCLHYAILYHLLDDA